MSEETMVVSPVMVFSTRQITIFSTTAQRAIYSNRADAKHASPLKILRGAVHSTRGQKLILLDLEPAKRDSFEPQKKYNARARS
jgi:hypothetical protein